jgi:hypothetical protein
MTREYHGFTGTSEHGIWMKMKQRCLNPKVKDYKNYGARGIKVCERWQKSFTAFLADMGARPSAESSIERIDNDGNYEPGNCRWATPIEQANNNRHNKYVTFQGVRVALSEACRLANSPVPQHRVRERLNKGWRLEAALTCPLHTRKRPDEIASRRDDLLDQLEAAE